VVSKVVSAWAFVDGRLHRELEECLMNRFLPAVSFTHSVGRLARNVLPMHTEKMLEYTYIMARTYKEGTDDDNTVC